MYKVFMKASDEETIPFKITAGNFEKDSIVRHSSFFFVDLPANELIVLEMFPKY